MGVGGGIKTNQSQNKPNGIPNKAGTTKLHAVLIGPPAQAISSPASTCPRRRLNLAPMTLKITVYSKSACPQCESAKSLLKARSLPYEEIKIDDEAERLAFYAKCGPAVRQMPQVFINDQRVGGLTGLQAALQQLGL